MTGRRSNLPPRINGKFTKSDNGLPSKTKEPKKYNSLKWQRIKNDPMTYLEHKLGMWIQTRKRAIIRCQRLIEVNKQELEHYRKQQLELREQLFAINPNYTPKHRRSTIEEIGSRKRRKDAKQTQVRETKLFDRLDLLALKDPIISKGRPSANAKISETSLVSNKSRQSHVA